MNTIYLQGKNIADGSMSAAGTCGVGGRRARLLDTLDRERGNCLMLYFDRLNVLNMMPEADQSVTLILLKRWFEGADEGDVMCAAYDHPRSQQIATALRLLIDDQKRHAEHYYCYCLSQRKRRLRAEAKKARMLTGESVAR